jgi:SAM-dependent methyltransferase
MRRASRADITACEVCRSTGVELFCTAVDRVLPRPGENWDILRCRACGFGWTSPPLAPAEIEAFYPPTYLGDTEKALGEHLSGHLARSRSWREELEKCRLLERFSPGGRILDVGCGDGRFLWALDETRWERTGVETMEATVELVRSRIPSLRLVCGDIGNDCLMPGTFEAVTFWHVLEHIPRPRAVLSRASALLRPGGWLIISLPDISSIQARLFRRYWYPFDDVPRHIYHFSRESLDRLLREAGLKVVEHLPFSPRVNFHSLKHSLLNWSEDRMGSRAPYYMLKPFLFGFPLVERVFRSYGILTSVSRKC